MFEDMIISCEQCDAPLLLTADDLHAAAQERWGDDVVIVPSRHERVEFRRDVIAGFGFYISVMKRFLSINIDGTPEQNIDAAVWLRSLMPADGPRIVAFDSGLTADVVLEPGMTIADLSAAAARSSSSIGWMAAGTRRSSKEDCHEAPRRIPVVGGDSR
ncbi:hypothetical protein ACGIF2_06945 [Cellulomonas sp. P22]|uniref:hypothetical protein n=1 Tax=Cellulomonas sp. P22 TaxID=3373189 RepID=UPI0037A110EB